MGKKNVKNRKKLLPKHEVFVQALAAGNERADAYAKAYPKSAHRSRDKLARAAFDLLQRPEVLSAYEAELEKHRAEEERRNRWTYERSVQERLEALEAITEERNRRRTAQETMATAMMEHPPEGLSPEEVVLKAQEILMQSILTAQTTSAVAQLCDGLDKLTGLTRDDGSNQTNVFITSDPWDKP